MKAKKKRKMAVNFESMWRGRKSRFDTGSNAYLRQLADQNRPAKPPQASNAKTSGFRTR